MKVAVLADVHANIFALEAVFADCAREGVEHFIVAGDLIGYYYWPRAVVRQLMSDARVTCIRGNHEAILEETLASNEAEKRYHRKYGSGYAVCRDSLNHDEMQWLLGLPQSAELQLGTTNFSVYHGSPKAADEYIYPDASSSVLDRCHVNRDFTILGHTHYPFVRHLGESVLLNPGSVGQPRDLGGFASYALVGVGNRSVRFKRVPFAVAHVVAAAKLRDPELPYLHMVMHRGLP